MGFEENSSLKRAEYRSTFADHATLAARESALEQRMVDEAKADARALWALADFYIPPDQKEFFERHGLKETGMEIVRQAFMMGWRAAHRAKRDVA